MPRDHGRSRLKVMYVSEETFLAICRAAYELKGQGSLLFCVPYWPELPDDVRIHRVYYDAGRMSFALILEHPSFEPVPPCSYPPEIACERVSMVIRGIDGKEI